MLALAIISTIILSIVILASFGETIVDNDEMFLGLFLAILLGFVIMTIWILYAR